MEFITSLMEAIWGPEMDPVAAIVLTLILIFPTWLVVRFVFFMILPKSWLRALSRATKIK